MTFQGANTEQLTAVSREIDQVAQSVQEIVRGVGTEAAALEWHGQDFFQFRNQMMWARSNELGVFVNGLSELADRLRANAGHQDSTSATLGVNGLGGILPGILQGLPGRPGIPEFPHTVPPPWLGLPGPLGGLEPGGFSWPKLEDLTGLGIDVLDVLDDASTLESLLNGLDATGGPSYLSFAVDGVRLLEAGVTEGWGSSEAVIATVEGAVSTIAEIAVPGLGPIVADATMEATGWVYENTPVGDVIEGNSPVIQQLDSVGDLSAAADQAMAQGDWDRASQLNDSARRLAADASERSEGWTGLGNATIAVAKSINPLSWF